MSETPHPSEIAIDRAIAQLEPQAIVKEDGLDPAWQLVDLLQSSRAIAKHLVDEMRAERGQKCFSCGRGGSKLRDVVRATSALQKSVDQMGVLTGKISSGSQVQILVDLGAQSMDELRDAMAMKRAGKDITLEAAFYDALDLVKMALMEHPDWSPRVLEAMGVKNALENGTYHA